VKPWEIAKSSNLYTKKLCQGQDPEDAGDGRRNLLDEGLRPPFVLGNVERQSMLRRRSRSWFRPRRPSAGGEHTHPTITTPHDSAAAIDTRRRTQPERRKQASAILELVAAARRQEKRRILALFPLIACRPRHAGSAPSQSRDRRAAPDRLATAS
jgi:hypothetical protein